MKKLERIAALEASKIAKKEKGSLLSILLFRLLNIKNRLVTVSFGNLCAFHFYLWFVAQYQNTLFILTLISIKHIFAM